VATLNALNIKEIPISGYINQLGQILLPVAKGLGFTVLPEVAIESFPQKHLLREYEPKHEVSEKLFAIRLRNRKLPARFDFLLHILHEL